MTFVIIFLILFYDVSVSPKPNHVSEGNWKDIINEWSKIPLSFRLASEKWYETLTIIMMIPYVMKTLTVAIACILGTEMVKIQ